MSELTTLFTNIANAIRTKTGESNQIAANQFPTNILNLPSGMSTPLALTSTANQDELKNLTRFLLVKSSGFRITTETFILWIYYDNGSWLIGDTMNRSYRVETPPSGNLTYDPNTGTVSHSPSWTITWIGACSLYK